MEKQQAISFTKLRPSDIKLCCCCQEISTSTSMWQIGEADEESYGQMLQDCFSIELDSEVDDVICAGCVSQLQAAVEFKCKVTNCQKKLKMTFIYTDKQLIFEEIKQWPNLMKQEIDNELDINQYIDNEYDVTLEPQYIDNDHVVTLEPDIFDEPLETIEIEEMNIEKTIEVEEMNIEKTIEVEEMNIEINCGDSKGPLETTEVEVVNIEMNNKCKRAPPKTKYIVNKDHFEKIDNKYVCMKCNKILSRYRGVISHLNHVHYKEPRKTIYTVNQDDFEIIDKKYVCKKCNKTLSDYRSVTRHLNDVHYKTPTCSCSECGEQFISQIKLKRHKVKVHNILDSRPSQVPSCDACGKKFLSNKHYKAHKSKCSDVIAKLRSLGLLKTVPLNTLNTTEKVSKAKYLCGTCSEEFPNESALVYHMQNHSRENKNMQIPPTEQPKAETLISQYKVLPGDYTKEGDKYVCNKCNRALSSYMSLARHINNTHYKNPLLSCDICGAKFLSKTRVTEHKFVAHNIDLRVTCNACDRQFWCPRVLERHNLTYHKLGPPKKCPHCDYTTHYTLKDHMSKHTTIEKYQCKFCPKKFKRFDSYHYHERIHKGDKRFVCKVCDARFVQRISLKCHIIKHHPDECPKPQ